MSESFDEKIKNNVLWYAIKEKHSYDKLIKVFAAITMWFSYLIICLIIFLMLRL
jgi:hypothetical protein